MHSILACCKLRDFAGIQLAERMQNRTLDVSLLKLSRRTYVQQKRILFSSLRGGYPPDRCFHACFWCIHLIVYNYITI